MQRPLVVLTVCYITGILVGDFTSFKVSVAMGLVIACFFVAVAGYVMAWRFNGRVLMALFLLLGLFYSRLFIEASKTPLVDYTGRQVTLAGRLVSGADIRSDKVFYLFEARELIKGEERQPVHGLVRLSTKDLEHIYAYGDLLLVRGQLSRPDTPGNPGAFNYRTYLERQGIWVILTANNENGLQKTGEDGGSILGRLALAIKHKLSTTATHTLSPSNGAILNGILFGIQGLIDQKTRQAFTETGVVHILSVSGLHVGLVLAGLIGLFGLLKLRPSLIAPLATPVLIFYALMTGLEPAVLRATIMALLLLWAHHLGRDRDWPTTLAFAALVILLWNPLQLYHPGFQLSFTATWGLLYLAPLLEKSISGLLQGLPPTMIRGTATGIAVPLAAQLATIPLVAWYYNMISPVSVLANLLAVPLTGLIMALGLLAAGAGLLWLPIAGFINAGTEVVIELFMGLIVFLQNLPGAVIYLATPPILLAILWYGGIFYAAGYARAEAGSPHRQKLKGWAPAGVALSILILIICWPGPDTQKLVVHFIDVGQGDSTLIQTPGGENLLIDTGGRPEEFQTGTGTGDQVVSPYLRKLGVNRLDVLFLTHPHEDHCGGAAYLIKNFPVDLVIASTTSANLSNVEAFTGSPPNNDRKENAAIPLGYHTLLKLMDEHGIEVQKVAAGDSIELPELAIEVLWPEANNAVEGDAANNSSLVLKLTYGHSSFIFTGDIEVEAQQKMLQNGSELKADVFKVPHHGSRSLLPQLVEKVDPSIAVISVGAHNSFGHPAPATIDLLDKKGITTYRTDMDGAVIVETDGNRIEVKKGKKR